MKPNNVATPTSGANTAGSRSTQPLPVNGNLRTRRSTTDNDEMLETVDYGFGVNRRNFVQLLGTGLLVAINAAPALAQRNGRRGNAGAKTIQARIHLGSDGRITLLTGKVEGGQGARAELCQAAAEELRVPVNHVTAIMADTNEVPDDGITAGSGSTPRTVPAVRQGAAAAREALIDFTAKRWGLERSKIQVRDGKAIQGIDDRTLSYAQFATDPDAATLLESAIPADVILTPTKEWKSLGNPAPRPNGSQIVTGAHKFPSDIVRPGMLYGRILRPISYGAKLTAIDPAPAKALKDVVVVQEDQFVGVAAPTTFQAEQALEALAQTAKWEPAAHPSSTELYDYLKDHAQGGLPANPFAEEIARAKTSLRGSYRVAYVQHAPLEPRAAVAEWADGKLTVWAGTQNPFGHRSELTRAFHIAEDKVRVIVPDFGAGFGGKHTAEASVEAARLAQGAGRPVCLRWTRQEEFAWAYFRPAAVIEVEASLDTQGTLTSWHFININSGGSAVETPYRVPKNQSRYVGSNAPLRHGSYRALAATANNFARESFMDELAVAAGTDPLDFRLAHLEHPRLRAVLETVAQRFGWKKRERNSTTGIGLACGTEKSSYVAACVEVEVDKAKKSFAVKKVTQVFECGAILNPQNLLKQVQGAIVMGLGPALREEMLFEKGQITNGTFRKYQVPRYSDLPELDIHLLNRPDLDSVGAGETPIIAVAPAIANAVFQATGVRVREMPIRLSG